MKSMTCVLAVLFSCISYPVFAVGAIAVDDPVGQDEPGYGYSTGYADRASAEKRALQECRKHGNQSCKVMVWFNTCGAYAASRRFTGIGWGSTRQAAENMALKQCAHNHCEIKITHCER